MSTAGGEPWRGADIVLQPPRAREVRDERRGTVMPSDLPDIPGYELRETLGRGGFATVYLARQILLDRLVALKVMDPRLARDQEFCERFVREAQDTASLGNHANIVTVFDIGHVGDVHYIAMQYLPGPNLKELLDADEPYRHPLHIVRALADALAYAHARGFVHRDVKPANVLFDEAGEAVLSDFGIAKSLDRGTCLTSTGTIVGTARYMSPEQAKGLDTIDCRSDLYSLGVVFFELLTRRPPFSARDPMTLMLMHVSEPIPQLPEPEVIYQPLIDRLMAKDPDERHDSGEALLEDVDRYMADPATTAAIDAHLGTDDRTRPAAFVALALTVSLAAVFGYLYLKPDSETASYAPSGAPRASNPVTDGDRARLERMLGIAELHELVGRISDPPGANAIEAYELMLELDPDHAAALDALTRLRNDSP